MSASEVAPITSAEKSDQGAGRRIGVFDSGLGGLSVLRALRARLPQAEILYVADSGHAPYGEKDLAHITERSLHISQFLIDQGVQAIVVACNTATAAAIHTLRQHWPDLPIIGVEPGVKPAVAASPHKRIGVLATPRTLASEKFRDLVQRHGQNARITLQACPGLAKEIEGGQLDTPRLRELIAQFVQPLKDADVDTVVLGCTHYPFVSHLITEALGPQVGIVDTAEAIARRVAQQVAVLPEPSLSPGLSAQSGRTRLWTTGDPAHLSQTVQRWLGLDVEVSALP